MTILAPKSLWPVSVEKREKRTALIIISAGVDPWLLVWLLRLLCRPLLAGSSTVISDQRHARVFAIATATKYIFGTIFSLNLALATLAWLCFFELSILVKVIVIPCSAATVLRAPYLNGRS